jgi:hypothetical protein
MSTPEATFSAFPPGTITRITKVRYIRATLGERSEVFRATRFYREAALQSAKEKFMYKHNVMPSRHGDITLEEVQYAPGMKYTII